MRVLVLSHMFPRIEGDWEGIFVLEQVQALRARGIDARVILGDAIWHYPPKSLLKEPVRVLLRRINRVKSASATSPDWRYIAGVPVASFAFDVAVEPWWGRIGPLTYALGALLLTRTLVKSFLPDVIHAHTSLLDGTAASVISKWLRRPYLITEHTGPFSVITRNPSSRRFVRRAAVGAKYFVSVSTHLQNDVLAQLGLSATPKNIVIPNGFNRRVFCPAPMPSMQTGIRVLWVGGFLENKQPILAVEAFAQAAAKNRKLSLTIVGEGVLEPEIKATVARLKLTDRVTVLPILPRKELADLIRSHHCVMVASKSETFCLVALEALACGRPVLTTACGGPVDFIGGTTRGRIVAGTRDDLAHGLLELTASLQRYDSTKLGEFALAGFSYESVAERLSALYEQVVKS